MVFDYLVKHNGIYYQAGEDVPIEGKAVNVPPTSPVEEVVKKPEMVDKPKSKGGRPRKAEV